MIFACYKTKLTKTGKNVLKTSLLSMRTEKRERMMKVKKLKSGYFIVDKGKLKK